LKIQEIERLIELVSRHKIGSLELKTGGMEIRITRNEGRGLMVTAGPLDAARSEGGAAPVQGHPAPEEPGAPPTAAEIEEQEGIQIIKATMVGTFFQAPSPGAEPFTPVGGIVRKGQVICIIEAMKIMNEIESEISGRVVRQFVEDAQPVEYGEPLFAVASD